MNNLSVLLNSIPATFWAALVGAMLALTGVLISNRGNTTRLKIQLQHDASEKAKERTATLRREIYLRTVEELVKANAHLASLPQLDLSKTNLNDGMLGLFSTAARLQLVAEPKTALLVNELVGSYGELILKLMTDLIPVNHARTDKDIADGMYNQAQAHISRLLSEMAKQNESGKPDPQAFAALGASLEFHQKQAQSYASQRQTAWENYNRGSQHFQRRLLGEIRELAPRQIPVMIEIRRDLGLTGDLSEIETAMRKQLQRMDENFEKLLLAIGAGEPLSRDDLQA